MFQRVFLAAIAGSITAAAIALTASAEPTADNRGNYNSTQNADKWEVIPDPAGVNCRKGPGVEFAIVAALEPKKIVEVSSEFSPQIQNDPRGNPWLAVSASGTSCFVRANSAFIRPEKETTEATPVAPQSTPTPPQAPENQNYSNSNIEGLEKWQVTPLRTGLNCRKGPGVEFPIVAALEPNKIVDISSEFSPQIQNDPRGNPWLAVSTSNTSCFVRANSAFIRPAQ